MPYQQPDDAYLLLALSSAPVSNKDKDIHAISHIWPQLVQILVKDNYNL